MPTSTETFPTVAPWEHPPPLWLKLDFWKTPDFYSLHPRSTSYDSVSGTTKFASFPGNIYRRPQKVFFDIKQTGKSDLFRRLSFCWIIFFWFFRLGLQPSPREISRLQHEELGGCRRVRETHGPRFGGPPPLRNEGLIFGLIKGNQWFS